MKIVYFNNSHLPKAVYRYNLHLENLIVNIEPKGQVDFDILTPEEGKAIFITEWDNIVMFSYTSRPS